MERGKGIRKTSKRTINIIERKRKKNHTSTMKEKKPKLTQRDTQTNIQRRSWIIAPAQKAVS